MEPNTFTFTLQTAEGNTYTYSGTLEGLHKHLKQNAHVRVLEDRTRFS